MRKILVAQTTHLLGAAIVNLLYREYNLNVIGCMADSLTELIEEIIYLQPDVVIVDQASHFTAAIHRLPDLCCCKLRLLIVSTEHNWVHMDHQHILITKRTDLAQIIRHSQNESPTDKSDQTHHINSS